MKIKDLSILCKWKNLKKLYYCELKNIWNNVKLFLNLIKVVSLKGDVRMCPFCFYLLWKLIKKTHFTAETNTWNALPLQSGYRLSFVFQAS